LGLFNPDGLQLELNKMENLCNEERMQHENVVKLSCSFIMCSEELFWSCYKNDFFFSDKFDNGIFA